MRLSNLEKRLFEDFPPDLARAALIASGVGTRRELESYIAKIDRLFERISDALAPDQAEWERARSIFDWLWKTKPHRYKPRGNYRLTDVTDAQIGGAD